MILSDKTRRLVLAVVQTVLISSLSYYVVNMWVRAWQANDPNREQDVQALRATRP